MWSNSFPMPLCPPLCWLTSYLSLNNLQNWNLSGRLHGLILVVLSLLPFSQWQWELKQVWLVVSFPLFSSCSLPWWWLREHHHHHLLMTWKSYIPLKVWWEMMRNDLTIITHTIGWAVITIPKTFHFLNRDTYRIRVENGMKKMSTKKMVLDLRTLAYIDVSAIMTLQVRWMRRWFDLIWFDLIWFDLIYTIIHFEK